MKKVNSFEIFGVFTSEDWSYATLVNRSKSHFVPIILLPFHKFYLDIINNPESPDNSYGPYSLLLDSWQSVGMSLKSIQFVVHSNEAGQTSTKGSYKLEMKNDIGTQIGIFHSDPTDALIVSAVVDIPIFVNDKTMPYLAIELSKNDLNDVEILNEVQSQMDVFCKKTSALKKPKSQ